MVSSDRLRSIFPRYIEGPFIAVAIGDDLQGHGGE